MTPNTFRRLALSIPGAVESSHMGHPDFRVGGKVFATIGYPDGGWAMVKLTPEQQAKFAKAAPKSFVPVPGGWGRRGSTNVLLSATDAATLKPALVTAWENITSKSGRKGNGAGPRGAESPSDRDLRQAFSRARVALRAAKLPEVQEGTSYGTPSLQVRGKSLMRVKDRDTLVFRCPIEEKPFLLEVAPDIYFETDHYKGWPAILIRLSKVSDAELKHCLERAWRMQAPAKLVRAFEEKTIHPNSKKPSTKRR